MAQEACSLGFLVSWLGGTSWPPGLGDERRAMQELPWTESGCDTAGGSLSGTCSVDTV